MLLKRLAAAMVVGLLAGAVPAAISAQEGEATLTLDVSTIPANRFFHASGTCPGATTEDPLPGAIFSLSDGTRLDSTGVWDGEIDQFPLVIPLSTEPGDYEVVLSCEGGAEARAPLTVTAGADRTIHVDDVSLAAGQTVRVTGTCNRVGERVQILLGTTYSRGQGGAFATEVTIPIDTRPLDSEDQTAGLWSLYSQCADYGGDSVVVKIVPAESAAADPVDADPSFTG